MKKMKFLLVALFAIMFSLSFTSCGDDDDEPTVDTLKTQFSYTYTFSQDLLDVADVTVYYIDTDGTEKSEAVTSTTWTKTFTADKFNVSAGVAFACKAKEGVELSKDTYKISHSIAYDHMTTKNSSVVDFVKNSFSGGGDVKSSKLNALLEIYGEESAYKADAQGAFSSTKLSWKENLPF